MTAPTTPPRDPQTISVIIPVCGDEAPLRRLLAQLAGLEIDEVIVARASAVLDGAKVKLRETITAGSVPVRWLDSAKGRGIQIANAAAQARGDISWIVHADSKVPDDAPGHIRATMANPAIAMGCFRLGFDVKHPALRLYGFFSRFDCMLTTFGDQGFFVRTDRFAQIGYCPRWPLFEDVAMRQSLRALGQIKKLPLVLETSARRFVALGPVRTQLLNLWLVLGFWAGRAPAHLALIYEREGMRAGRTQKPAQDVATIPARTPQPPS
ncbi:MAG: glycosyltransferase [Pseudomonadota bacterium]